MGELGFLAAAAGAPGLAGIYREAEARGRSATARALVAGRTRTRLGFSRLVVQCNATSGEEWHTTPWTVETTLFGFRCLRFSTRRGKRLSVSGNPICVFDPATTNNRILVTCLMQRQRL